MSDFSSALKPGDIVNLEGYCPFDWKKWAWSWAERRAIDLIVDDQGFVFNSKLKDKSMLTRDNHSTMYVGGGKIFSQEPPHATIIPVSDYENDPRIITIYRMNPIYFGRELTKNDVDLLIEACDIMASRKVPYDIARDVQDGIEDMTQRPWDSDLNIFDTQCNGSDDPTLISSAVCSQAVAIAIAHWRHQTQATTGELIKAPWHDLNSNAWIQKQLDEYPHYWDTAIVHPSNYSVSHECFYDEFIRIGRFKKGVRIA
jgi:hypothetical protein